jgi:hypothetical protein
MFTDAYRSHDLIPARVEFTVRGGNATGPRDAERY